MKIFLTGVPGVGKTTVVKRVVEALGDRADGFITRETREGGIRTGFVIESLDGTTSPLATVKSNEGPRVGRYHVIVSNLESVALAAIQRALDQSKIVVIDEIGKMELMSQKFRDMILKALGSDASTLATLGIANHPLLNSIRRRRDVELIKVTIENRDSLPERILTMFEQGGG